MVPIKQTLHNVKAFGAGMWRYWRRGEPSPESNFVVQKLYAYTDGRSNDILFRMLESKREEQNPSFEWDGNSLESSSEDLPNSIDQTVLRLKEDGVVVLPLRLKKDALQSLYNLGSSAHLQTTTFGPLPNGQAAGTQTNIPIVDRGTSDGINLQQPRASVYEVPRTLLLENKYLQSLLCDPYLLTVATRYLGVFPVVTKPDMWWDTDRIPPGVRPRPFHTDSGCLRWLKVGINLTATTFDTPHFVYVKGSHRPNRTTRPLTRRLSSRMNLSDKEVAEICPEKIIHVTAPAGSITLADTRGIHKGELSHQGHRLILYFGLEGSAFNNIDKPVPINQVGNELAKAMAARPFSYQFFRRAEGN